MNNETKDSMPNVFHPETNDTVDYFQVDCNDILPSGATVTSTMLNTTSLTDSPSMPPVTRPRDPTDPPTETSESNSQFRRKFMEQSKCTFQPMANYPLCQWVMKKR